MYEFFLNNKSFISLHSPTFICKQKNGYFTLCDEAQAQGVVINNVTYHIHSKPDIGEFSTVVMQKISEDVNQTEEMQVQSDIDGITVDHELRITMLELGLEG